MADNPAPTIAAPARPAAAPDVPHRRRVRPWLVAGAVACALGAWWFTGRKVRLWGDGQSLHAADVKADPREVVWTPPEPLDGVNTPDQEYEPSVSPDGTELYFVRGKATRNAEIHVSYRRSNAWTEPAPLASVNSEHDELGPRLTADGMFLLFASDRPGGMGQYDIWASPRLPGKDGGWGEPFNLGPAINGEFNEYNPSPTPDGRRLMFATNRRAAQQEQKEAWRATIRASSISDYDLWIAELDRAATAEAQAAAPPATQPAAAPDPGGFSLSSPSPGTLYLNIIAPADVSAAASTQPATRPADADWEDALRGGDPFALAPGGPPRIEPPRVEVAPPVLRLPTTRPADPAVDAAPATQPAPATAPARPATRQAEAPVLLVFEPAAELPGVNTPFHEGASCLSPAGDFLYFASNRTGGHGKFDLYRCRVLGEVSGGVGVKLGEVQNVGRPINTPDNETDPQLALGGFKLYMSSDRQTADGRYHGYDLLHSDSREVYDARLGRPVPRLGWSWWVLLGSVLLLLPLLMFMRRWDEARLNLLQKCLLVALLIHVLVIGALSFVPVSVKLIEYVKHETGMVEVTIDLEGPGGGEGAIGLAIRQQSSSDLPVAAAPPGSLGPVDTGAPVQGKPAGVQVGVPAAAGRSEPLAIQAAAPRVELPPAPQVTGVAPVARPDAMALDVKVAAAPQINQLEVGLTADAVQAPAPRADAVAPRVAPVEVKVDAAPAAPNVGSLTAAVAPPRPQAPAVAAVETGLRIAEPAAGAAPRVEGPKADLARVAAGGPDAPAAAETNIVVGKIGGGGSGAGAAKIETSLPAAAGVAGGSIAPAPDAGPLPGAAALDVAKGIGEANVVAAGTPAAGVGPSVGGIAPAVEKLAAGGGDAPNSAEAVAGVGPLGGTGNISAASAGAAKLELDLPAAGGAGNSLAAGPGQMASAGAAGAGANVPGVAVAAAGAGAPAGAVQVEVKLAGARVGGADALPTAGLPDAMGPATRPSAPGSAVARSEGPAGDVAPGAAPAAAAGGSSLLAGPTTRPFDGTGVAVAAPAPPSGGAVSAAADAAFRPAVTGPRIDVGHLAAGPSTAPSGAEIAVAAPKSAAAPAAGGATGAAAVAGAAANVPAAAAGAGQSLVSTGPIPARSGNVIPPAALAASTPGAAPGVSGPQIGPVQIATAPKLGPGAPGGSPAGASEVPGGGPDGAALAGTGKAAVAGDGGKGERPILASMNIPAVGAVPGAGRGGSGGAAINAPAGARPLVAPLAAVTPELGVALPKLSAPQALVQRSAEQRRPLVEERGGTRESENAVHRGLGYLARQQEPDGRWTVITDDRSRPGKRAKTTHDMACTGLAVLCFLASDHTPDKEGAYRETVARGLEYLVAQQDDDGDLRGPKEFRGGGSDRGNMYDHGIATMAVAEAALMTGDKRYTDAAMKAADFIIRSQDRRGGGWRYLPGEAGDTSVFGWQILALHNCEQLGYEVPDSSKALSRRFLRTVSEGRHKMLARYLPGGRGPDAVMTAEAMFCRILLDEPVTNEAAREASEAITSRLPASRDANLYFWYYASLSLNQLNNDAWKKWNEKTRDRLIAMQKRGGATDGAWPGTNHYDARAGRIYTTALATLTLQVYYRYLPVNPENTGKGDGEARRESDDRPRNRRPPLAAPRRVLEPS